MTLATDIGNGLRERLFRIAARKRTRIGISLLADSTVIAIAAAAALGLVAPVSDESLTLGGIATVVALALVVKLPVLHALGIYRISASRMDGPDMYRMARILLVAGLAFIVTTIALVMATADGARPIRFVVLDFILASSMIGGLRVSVRIASDTRRRQRNSPDVPVLIYGAGDAGLQVLRAIREEIETSYWPRGFIDDDPNKLGLRMSGLSVLGGRSELRRLAEQLGRPELWIAMPSVPGNEIRKIVDLARSAGYSRVKVVPGLGALISGQIGIHDIRDVQLEELLGREPVQINTGEVGRFLTGRRVLVTGAAGSIGSELCVQIARFNPSELAVFDQDETGVFDLTNGLRANYPSLRVFQVVGDVQDADKVDRVFAAFRPHVVFHAAAYKHVPLMEDHPDQAVKTNVLGTMVVARAAKRHDADRFVLISTDKAVNPTSVMGATKRAAELLIQQVGDDSPTDFIAVRFGNVLGSRGSVVPLFKSQIARGGPVTVTHPEMKRYFMTIPEAVLLVLQAGAIGESGQVLVLDMGEPIKIVELARQLITLSGLRPDIDIPIVFTGARPGEKLFEDILSAEEGTTSTKHDRVFVARVGQRLTRHEFEQHLNALTQAVKSGDKEDVIGAIAALVTSYQPEGQCRVGEPVPA